MFSENKNNRSEQTGLTNRIIKSTIIKGEIVSKTDFRIDGKLDGEIKVEGKLVIGKTGVVTGKVECEHMDIEGFFKGNVLVRGLLYLKSTAKLDGEVITGKLAVEDGAVFNASCNMKDIKSVQNDGVSTLKSLKKGKQIA